MVASNTGIVPYPFRAIMFQDGNRAIHLAIQNQDQEAVKLLKDFSADINSPNYRRMTPLSLACKLQDWQMVNFLLDLKVLYKQTSCTSIWSMN